MTGVAVSTKPELGQPIGDELPQGTTLCFGQYEIVKYLNSGGFGITYLALDSLGRKVVIKECFPGAMCRRSGQQLSLRTPSYLNDFERVVELFEREARALAQLQHPNIVGVHQIFHDNGTAYMALDFVEGMDLLQVIERTPKKLSPPEVRRITILLLHALAYVHRNGILHRDISPDNILLDKDGSPVLIDFGAARAGATRASRILSRVQTVKDGYSPQEFYLASGSQEVPSDLYSLAATIHHLIAGSPPPNSTLRLAAVAENQPDPYVPLRRRVRGYDANFLNAVDQCLSVFSKDRLKSAAQWLDQIDQARRKQALLRQAEEDRKIEMTITQLVEETRVAIGDDRPTKKVAPSREAELEAERKRKAEREYWAILNEAPEPESEADHEAEPEPVFEAVQPVGTGAAEAPQKPKIVHPDDPVSKRRKRRLSLLVILGLILIGPFWNRIDANLPASDVIAAGIIEAEQ